MATVQCSNNILSDRIHKISDHIEDELIDKWKEPCLCKATGRKYECCWTSNAASFCQIMNDDDLFLCASLEANSTGEENFEVIDEYIKTNYLLEQMY